MSESTRIVCQTRDERGRFGTHAITLVNVEVYGNANAGFVVRPSVEWERKMTSNLSKPNEKVFAETVHELRELRRFVFWQRILWAAAVIVAALLSHWLTLRAGAP